MAASSPAANRMKTVTISMSLNSIHIAAAFPGTRPKIWRCKFRTVTSRAPKRSTLTSTGIARQHRSFITCRLETIATGRIALSGVKTTIPASGYTIGYVRDLSHDNGIDIGLGTQFTINDRSDNLDRYYGDDLGYAFEFFLRIRPSLHAHGSHEYAEHVAGMEK